MILNEACHKLVPQTIPIHHIQEGPGPFTISYDFDLALLSASLREIGLVNPPLLKVNPQGGSFVIITGYRRIAAARLLGWDALFCRLLPEEESPDPLQCFLINLLENITVRTLNPVEKGMALQRLMKWVPKQEVLDRYVPLMGLPPQEDALDLHIGLQYFLEDTRKAIAREEISLKAVKKMMGLDPSTREALAQTIQILSLNFNYQLQFIDLITDLSFISNKEIQALLQERGAREICNRPNLNRPQKARAMLKYLRNKRLPTLSRAEREFRKRVRDLDLPSGVKIQAPTYFEGADYRMEILFRNGKELLETLMRVKGAADLEHFQDPWNAE